MGCILLELALTLSLTPRFDARKHPAQLAYLIGSSLIVAMCLGVSYAAAMVKGFVPWAEITIAVGGSVVECVLVLLADHWRVAALAGEDPKLLWGRLVS